MNTILDAVMAAQARNTEEDRLRKLREQDMKSVLPGFGQPNPFVPFPIQNVINDSDGGDDGPKTDNRTEQQKYNDAVESNRKGFGNLSTIAGVMNDIYISNYEKTNPLDDPVGKQYRDRFSKVGQVLGGLGWPAYTTVGDRFVGREPTWAESLARINYSVPVTRDWSRGGVAVDRWGDSDAGQQQRDGTTSYGGRESAVGQDDRSGYA